MRTIPALESAAYQGEIEWPQAWLALITGLQWLLWAGRPTASRVEQQFERVKVLGSIWIGMELIAGCSAAGLCTSGSSPARMTTFDVAVCRAGYDLIKVAVLDCGPAATPSRSASPYAETTDQQ